MFSEAVSDKSPTVADKMLRDEQALIEKREARKKRVEQILLGIVSEFIRFSLAVLLRLFTSVHGLYSNMLTFLNAVAQ